MHQLVNHKLTEQTDLSSIVHLHSGAAYLPPPLAKKMRGYAKNTPLVYQGESFHPITVGATHRQLDVRLRHV